MTVATAGHIDHGKSALVEALSGTHPDRLPEEQRRGMTLDLGFAHFEHAGVNIAFVDVPGHERFVRTMLAGAGGVDAVLLVVACDRGVQPQTREHAAICQLLGLRRGIVVLSKCDLVDAGRLAQMREQVRGLARGTFLEAAEPIAVSARTGEGIVAVRAALAALAEGLPARDAKEPLRLPVDRVFTLRGFGTVVTGTLLQGQLQAGDEVELIPGGQRVRVRGVQVHSRPVEAALAGERTAANLAGVDSAGLHRGMELGEPGVWEATEVLDVALTLLPGLELRQRARVRLHLHTAEALAGLVWLEPGRYAQLRLETPLLAAPGDRLVLRQLSPALTLAGGVVLDPHPARHRRPGYADAAGRLAALVSAPDLRARLRLVLEAAGTAGCGLAALAQRCGCRVAEAQAALEDAAVFDAHQQAALAPAALAELETALLAAARESGKLAAGEGWPALAAERLRTSGRWRADDSAAAARARVRGRLEERFRELGWSAPRLPGLLAVFPEPEARAAAAELARSGAIIECQPGWFLHASALERLRALLAERKAVQASFSVAEFKQWTGLTRKLAIPLLEYCDRARLTVRRGDAREIR